MTMIRLLPGVLGTAAILVGGCGRSGTDAAPVAATVEVDGPLAVYAVNYPLAYFAERIGGDEVVVHFPVPAGDDPALWSPGAAVIRDYQSADVILLNGATYARWVEHATLPPSKLVDTSAAFRDAYIAIEDTVTHTHGPTGAHAHTGTAFTTWLDFEQAAQQAAAVRDALIERRPGTASEFQTRGDALERDLQDLHRSMLDAVGTQGDRPIIVSHPVYQYWARAYGLNVRNVHWEPDVVPDDEAWASLGALLEEHPAKWMVWEAAPAAISTERLSAFDVQSAVFAPCGNRPEDGDFLDVMQTNVDNVRKVFLP